MHIKETAYRFYSNSNLTFSMVFIALMLTLFTLSLIVWAVFHSTSKMSHQIKKQSKK